MSSGRKPRIMIACVTFETVKVAEPVDFYQANKVYLIHHSSTKYPIYLEFYNRTCEMIRESNGDKVEIIEMDEKVWEFGSMLRTIVGIIDRENRESGECDIYVNISSGSPEYSAAATIGSMMYSNVTPFAVPVKDSTVDDEQVRECYFRKVVDENGIERDIPVGLAASIKDPVKIPHYHIKKPPEVLVRGLRIYYKYAGDGPKTKRVTAPMVIRDLEERGMWDHPTEGKDKNKIDASNAVYFHREFIERWVKHQWIVRDDTGKRYMLTDEGKRMIETFYTDE